MSDYDETFLRIRQTNLRHKARFVERLAEVEAEVVALLTRFAAAGWTTVWDRPLRSACLEMRVEVRDPSGSICRWYLPRADHVKDCLKALEAAERAAKEVK